jgi:hypothetical protein
LILKIQKSREKAFNRFSYNNDILYDVLSTILDRVRYFGYEKAISSMFLIEKKDIKNVINIFKDLNKKCLIFVLDTNLNSLLLKEEKWFGTKYRIEYLDGKRKLRHLLAFAIEPIQYDKD